MNPTLRRLARLIPLLLLILVPVPSARAAALPAPIDQPMVITSSPIKAPYSESPFLTSGPDGAWLTWLERRGEGGHRLMMSSYRAGAWRPARTLLSSDSLLVNWAEIPQLLPFASGRFALSWPWKTADDVLSYGVRVAFGGPIGKLGPPVTPHADHSRTPHGFQSMLAEGDGARIVWVDGRASMPRPDSTGDTQLRTALVSAAGRVTGEKVLDPRICECCRTSMVKVPGGVLVAYRGRTKAEVRDIMLVRSENGQWGEPHALSHDGWTVRGCPVNGPAAASRGNNVVVAWFTQPTGVPRVNVAFSNDGGKSFAAPVTVDSITAVGRPQVMFLEDDSVLLLWEARKRRNVVACVARVMPDGRSSAPTTIGIMPAKAGGYPQMARVGDRMLFGWCDAVTTKPFSVQIYQARLMPLR